MVHQGHFGHVFLHPANDHLLDHSFGLAAFAGDVHLDLLFFFDDFSVQICFGQRCRVHSRDVHRNLFAKAFVAAGHCDQNADFAHAVGGCVVNVGHDCVTRHSCHAAHGHVFTDNRNGVDNGLFNGLAVHVSRFQRVHIVNRQCHLRDAADHFLEVCVFANEVGFRVHLNSDPFAAGHCNGHKTFCCGAAGLFGCFGKTFGPQPVNGRFHVAICFGQCLFGVHHACASAVAQFFYQ